MTYFGFLVRFLVVPILALLLALMWDRQRGLGLPSSLRNLPAWAVVALHVLVALLYTTPWDNYLVATRVWWYDPNLVTGITLGWVPIEEYTFFVLQTLLTGLWLLWLAPRLARAPGWAPDGRIQRLAVLIAGLLWLPTPFLLAVRVVPATYLALILVWALPPVALQLAFGADILWRYRRLVTAAVLVPTVYLWLADTLAIRLGIWTISPRQTLELCLPGGLPLEEATFFLMTNVLIGFGITLALAEESKMRLRIFQRVLGMQTDSAEP
jgi:lycopene cyclase domain-containing protein